MTNREVGESAVPYQLSHPRLNTRKLTLSTRASFSPIRSTSFSSSSRNPLGEEKSSFGGGAYRRVSAKAIVAF